MSERLIRVTHSIPSEEALIAAVLPKYPIPRPRNCRLHKRGLNDTYRVETDTELYILRIYRCNWRTKDEIDFELELLTFLHDHQLPVAYPVSTKQGNLTEVILAPEGRRYVVLFSYAPGRAVNEQLNEQQSQKLGLVLAHIHQWTINFSSSFNRQALHSEYLLDWAWTSISSLFEYKRRDCRFIQAQVEHVKAEIEALKLPKQSPDYGICVGDVHSGNAHFSEANEPTLFDFDQCGYGWRAFDIAKFLHVSYTWKIDKIVCQAFLAGYQTIRKLNDLELASIPVFTKAAHIWVMGINASVAGEVVPYSHYTDEWFDAKLALLDQLAGNQVDVV